MHNLIVGITYTGKTNLCKSIAHNSDKNIIVYDPLSSTGWGDNAIKFSSPDKFFKYIETAQNAFVFVDEGKTLWDVNPKEADKLLYKRRHQGLLTFVIAQRTMMIPPNARNMCSKVFAFKQRKNDCDILREEYGEAFAQCLNLELGEFIATDGFNVSRMYLDYSQFPPLIKEKAET